MRFQFLLPLAAAAALLASGISNSAASDNAVRALVTQVSGEVTILHPGARNGHGSAPHTPRVLDLISAGSILRLDDGEEIVVLCSIEHLVSLEGPTERSLDTELCRSGRRQPAGSFRGALPARGRLVAVGDVLALEMTTRADQTRAVPILLAPRNTALVDGTPELVWTATPGAIEYEVQVLGPPPLGSHPVTLEPPEADCGATRKDWPGVEVCSLGWSEIVGSTEIREAGVYLEVGSRFALAAPVRKQDLSPRARTLSPPDRKEVRDRLRELPARDEAPFLHALLAVRPLIEHELYDAARERLLAALEIRDAPALRVTLGDVYMETELPEWAAETYRRAAESAADPAVVGSAHYGWGRAEFALDRFDSAREHFERAAEEFRRAGLAHERSAAVEAAAQTRERGETG